MKLVLGLAVQLSWALLVRSVTFEAELLTTLGDKYPATSPLDVDIGDTIRIFCNTTGTLYRHVNATEFNTCNHTTPPAEIGRCFTGNPPLLVHILRQSRDLPSVLSYEEGTTYYISSFTTKTELPSGPDCSLGTKMAIQVAGAGAVTTSASSSATIDLDTQGLADRNNTLSTTTIIIICAATGGSILFVVVCTGLLVLALCFCGGKKKNVPVRNQPEKAESSVKLLSSDSTKPVAAENSTKSVADKPVSESVSIKIHGNDSVRFSKKSGKDSYDGEKKVPARPAPVPSAEQKSSLNNRVGPSDTKPINGHHHRETPSSSNHVSRSMTVGGVQKECPHTTSSYTPHRSRLSPIRTKHGGTGGTNLGANGSNLRANDLGANTGASNLRANRGDVGAKGGSNLRANDLGANTGANNRSNGRNLAPNTKGGSNSDGNKSARSSGSSYRAQNESSTGQKGKSAWSPGNSPARAQNKSSMGQQRPPNYRQTVNKNKI